MLTDSDKTRILELGFGRSSPVGGFEKHFVKVLRGAARPLTDRERDWVAYWNEQERSDRPVARSPTVDPPSRKRAGSLIDGIVLAANLAANIRSTADVVADPLLARALEMTTNRAVSDLMADPEALRGALNAAKGKYFELLVQDRLNAGEAVGDLVLADGQRAELAQSMTQPGWDLAVLGDDGRVVDVVQLKATQSVQYIRETLERYPDIKVLSTQEAANVQEAQGLVLDSGISNEDIQRLVGDFLGAQSDSFMQSFMEAFNPLFPLVFILATEGYKVVVDRRSVESAVKSASDRVAHSLTGAAVGAVFYAMGFGWLSLIPAAVAGRAGPQGIVSFVEAWYQSQREEELQTRDAYNAAAAARYNCKLQECGATREVTAEQMEAMRVGLTGIPVIDRTLSDFARGWNLAKEPEFKEAIRRQNEAEFERAKRRALERLDNDLGLKPK